MSIKHALIVLHFFFVFVLFFFVLFFLFLLEQKTKHTKKKHTQKKTDKKKNNNNTKKMCTDPDWSQLTQSDQLVLDKEILFIIKQSELCNSLSIDIIWVYTYSNASVYYGDDIK